MASNGTGEATLAFVIVKGKQYQVTSIDDSDESVVVAHRHTASHTVAAHSQGDKAWKVDLEWDVLPDADNFDPSMIGPQSPADVVVVKPDKRVRYVQGVRVSSSSNFKVSDKWVGRCTIGEFKDCRVE